MCQLILTKSFFLDFGFRDGFECFKPESCFFAAGFFPFFHVDWGEHIFTSLSFDVSIITYTFKKVNIY